MLMRKLNQAAMKGTVIQCTLYSVLVQLYVHRFYYTKLSLASMYMIK